MEFDSGSVRRLRSKESVAFHCQRCGDCCRHLRKQAMVESLDGYRIVQYLRTHGHPDMDLGEFYAVYTTPVILLGLYPIFMVETEGPEDACVFLKDGACSIYPARMRVCRLYPFTVDTGERGQDFIWYLCLERPFHRANGTVRVKDWFRQNFSKEDRAFVKRESTTVPQIGRLLQGMEEEQLRIAHREICMLRYLLFEVDEPFLPQYDRNTEELLRRLQRLRDA